MTGAGPERVVIIGGGIGALTAAYYLSDPALNGKYQISIHTMGWRLGGKGASGRNAAVHQRIEEHGLHIWFGCYHNALNLMSAAYKEMARPQGAPLATMDEAFKPQSDLVLMERVEDEWRTWPIRFPELPATDDDVPTVLGFIKRQIFWLRGRVEAHGGPAERAIDEMFDAFEWGEGELERIASLFGGQDTARRQSVVDLLQRSEACAGCLSDDYHEVKSQHIGPISDLLKLTARALWWVLKDNLPEDNIERRLWILTYLGITFVRGMIDDELYRRGFGAVEDEEFRAWLRRNSSMAGVADGLPDRLAFESPNVQAFYDAAFCYLDGNNETPNVSATVALRCMLRVLLDYRGAFVYEMQAGMGDTVFTPFYEILKKRGVEINFFERLTDVELAGAGGSIQRIEISRQVKLGRPYQPLVTVKDLPCWPSEPLYHQIEDGSELQRSGANLEHWDSGWSDTGGSYALEKGRDFDWLVLGISYMVLPQVSAALAVASTEWRKMIHGLNATATQAWQAWFVPNRAELGMQGPPAIIGAYVEPFSSLVDFSHLIPREDWPANAVNFLAYDCGVMQTGPGSDLKAVFGRLRSFMTTDAQPIWPDASERADPDHLRWDVLWAPAGVSGITRLEHQYWRANTDPTEQYVLSIAGTGGARLKAKPADFDNLVIAGEWTDTGLNISSVETATMSGMQAARAISGHPARIIGERDL